MLKRMLLLVLLAAWPATIAAGADLFDESLPQISWDQAPEHYDQRCIVYGTIVRTKDIGRRCFLNFHPDFRNSLTVMISQKYYEKFPVAPVEAYLDKHIRVVGEITKYKNSPQIVVKSPDQIEIVDDPNPPATAAAPKKAPASSADKKKKKDPAPSVPPKRTAPRAAAPADGVIKVATFNLYNLFDDHDDPYLEQEPLPGKSLEEVKRLAEIIRKIDADVLALQEVENRPFLEEFVEKYLADMGYREVVLYEGNYWRGVDVALLSRFPVGQVTSYRHLDFTDPNGALMRFQRDLLQVNIQPKGLADFDVFVVHLKSMLGDKEKTQALKMGEAGAIRSIFDDILSHDPTARFLICGDFNDHADSPLMRRIIGTGPTALGTFFQDIPPEKQITYNKEPYRSMIDFILASPALGKCYRKDSCEILYGTVESSGSDHNPVVSRFKLNRDGHK